MASQAFYGLSITHQSILNDAVVKSEEHYQHALRALVKASYFVADEMLKEDKRQPPF